jgi:L,D-transpeptidase ErfK/SrfK
MTLVGRIGGHTVAEGETLLDISRRYGLGFNELDSLYSELDPWLPEVGSDLTIPSQWILPSTRHQEVVVNLAELRLYRFFPRITMVKTYPIGIGDLDSETPEGVYSVTEKKVDPTWTVPKALRRAYGLVCIPPGPQNPLGGYWIGLSRRGYGIHGTNFAWGIGRLVSHGCIRLYPEDIEQLFREVSIGTIVEVTYEPVKIGLRNRRVFLEVHPDVYGKVLDMEMHTEKRLEKLMLLKHISLEKMRAVVQRQNGLPQPIGDIPSDFPSGTTNITNEKEGTK